MIAKVDREGRIVVPKKLREKLGLRAGMEIEVAETSDGLTLKPVTKKSSLTREGRFLVHTGKPIHGYSVSDAVHEDREARLRKLARL
ncbi:MAG TPA: AbrB/MazE/SpoVT family DNA-binding domain-containing protein [Terriglobales bacterium]|nr:AbrB/MazE/SpoVT family DNA-binding domain-containing protein [Terriglobales bacterium]